VAFYFSQEIFMGNFDEEKNSPDTDVREESYIHSEEKPKSRKGIWVALGGLLIILSKFKFGVLFLLSKLKFLFVFLKLGKFVTTFGSMFFMIVVYAQLYGWTFGIGFVLLIFVHEMGHFITAKHVGLKVTSPLFIPFVGAFISMKEQPADAVTEAKVALGGPVLGSLGALACVLLYPVTGQGFWLALAYSGFMINMFNLIPFHPLDGGRIASAISIKMWLVGIPLALLAAFKFFNPIIILLLIMGGIQMYRQWKTPNTEYYNVPFATRVIFASSYFGLITLLGIGMAYILSMHLPT
jgi:Zn-dependent protease